MRGKFIITYQSDLKQIEFIEQADEETLLIIFSNSGGFYSDNNLEMIYPTEMYLKTQKPRFS